MEIHLDPIGGIAGDMFIAAVLNAFPDLEAGMLESIGAVSGGRVSCDVVPHRDATLAGTRFVVEERAAHRHDHRHVAWADIREMLLGSPLPAKARDTAVAIFALLAEAETRVHGIAVDRVEFHEVGAADSVADIVGAAHLIAALGAERWSVAPLPLGSGRVRTAHGMLPVPAPATALLLEGMATYDDGVAGERVTPTGAAILRHLSPASARNRQPRTLVRSGIGFGTKVFPGLSNCLRLLAFEAAPRQADHRQLAVVSFEVDDQAAEETAMGLDRLRRSEGVLDVLQMPAFGKKGRMVTHIQVLAAPDDLEEAIASCFRETTTIGLRHHLVSGAALKREFATVEIEGRPIRVKLVDRPGIGRTAKAEADDVADAGGHAERARLRRAAEAAALRDASAAPEEPARSPQAVE
jgi:uncharacterized protein (TIGR00299 family) protein